MKRKIMADLIRWRNTGSERLPLLLYGARQVGKTYIMKELGIELFKNTIYINFESDEAIKAYFETDIHADSVIKCLESYYSIKIVPDETLIIFDEIQTCERALTSLKYFAEETPEYHVIAAGSLLGVAINRERFSFPVGKVLMLNMYPLDFEEYLWAEGKTLLADTIRNHFYDNTQMPDALHAEALREYNKYCIIGGMPAAVTASISPNPTINHEDIRRMLLDSYISDMAKYASPDQTVKIYAAYNSLPAQLARDSKKFQYKLIRSGARSSQYGDSIDWLIKAGIVYPCIKCSQGYLPSTAYQDAASFKLYYSDPGILSARTNMTAGRLSSPECEHFRGIYAENYVACALKSLGYKLYYWESEGTAEIDFLITVDEHVIPVECKAGNHVKSKSLSVYRDKYDPAYAIRISARNFGYVDQIKSVPLYAVFCLPQGNTSV